MKHLKNLISAVLAGIVFSVGAVAQIELTDSSKIASAVIFGVCILIMLTLNLGFFDGKICYIFIEPKRADKRFFESIVTLIGNVAGCAACGFAFSSVYGSASKAIIEARTEMSPVAILVKAVFCGAVLFIATHCYRRHNGGTVGCVISLLAASSAALCGFVHAISDIFYFSASLSFDVKMPVYLLITVVGNAIGAVLFALLYEAKKSDNEVHYRKSHHHNKTEE